MKAQPRLALALGLALSPWSAACRSSPYGEIERADAAHHLELAEKEIAEGKLQQALERLAAVHDVSGLDPDARSREERLIEEAARRRFEELADAPASELEALFDSELPDRVRARAGLLAAERLAAEGSRVKAFRMVKKVDQEIPSHPERVLSGDILARVGLALIRDPGRYGFFLRYRTRGVQALEYLVVQYPLEPRCPAAYAALSEYYESTGDLDAAIEHTENLLLYHPQSPHAVIAAVRLPYLRLRRIKRDDYDRSELVRAQREVDHWLSVYPEHELAEWARELASECRLRLVRSDLKLARYYERTEAPAGIRIHASRALATAQAAGLEAEAEEARALLEDVPAPAPEEPAMPLVAPGGA